MRSFKDNYIWLTGASSGIGRELALYLLKEGAHLCVTARNRQALESLPLSEKSFIVAFDVSKREAYTTVTKEIQDKWGHLDRVILNAGTCRYIDLENMDLDLFEQIIQTNFLSTVYGVHAALPLLKKSSIKQVVTVSSLNAYMGLPRAEAYGPSKAAITNFSQSLRLHGKSLGLRVTNVTC